jgi:hypothetical protein
VHLLADLRYHWTETKPRSDAAMRGAGFETDHPFGIAAPFCRLRGPPLLALTLPLSLSCALRGHFPGSVPRRLSPLR